MIRIRKGLNIPITGLPDQRITEGNPVKTVALLGSDYVGMKPTMMTSEGDVVQAGQLLFTDKKIPGVRYTSPVSGRVKAIHRGEKRVLQSVVIECNNKEGLQFQAYSVSDLPSLSRDQVKEQLITSGMWCALRTRPYSKVPDPESEPHSIFVAAMDTRPLSANPDVIIKMHQADFSSGLQVLNHLTSGKLYLCTAPGSDIPSKPAEQIVFSGPHPAGLVGTHIHFIDPVSDNKTVWHIGYQDVIGIGKLFTSGQLWQQRVIALSGPQVKNPRLIVTLLGASLDEIVDNELVSGDNRVISGSVLGGRHGAGVLNFLGRYHDQVSVLKEGKERPFLHYLSPGLNRFSVLPIYVSRFLKRRFNMTTTTNGSPRAMVPVGSYERVMPLDILPTQLLRSLIVSDIEMAQELGMLELDEEDLALCTFVCPGKYEYGPLLRDNLTLMAKEG